MSKRKPHSLHRRYERQARIAVKNIAAAFVTGNTHVECVDIKRREIIKAGPTLANAIAKTPYKWSVLLCVLGIDHDGKPYVKSEEHAMTVRYKQSNLCEYLNEQHQAYIERYANKSQMIAAGWIASPEGKPLDNEVAFEIFNKMGAFA